MTRRRRRARRGTAAVEMAFILPLFVALVLGQIEMMRLGMVGQLLHIAAREACRVAVIPGRTQADVQTRVDSVLQGTGISVGAVAPTPTNWATAPGGTAITVALSVPYSQVSWLPAPPRLGDKVVRASATMNSERP